MYNQNFRIVLFICLSLGSWCWITVGQYQSRQLLSPSRYNSGPPVLSGYPDYYNNPRPQPYPPNNHESNYFPRYPGPIQNPSSSCVDRLNRPTKCAPEFINAAYNSPIEATNTCGLNGPSQYCFQTGHGGYTTTRKTCEICDARNPLWAHPPENMIDVDQHDRITWWQSETMFEGTKQVNITVPLGKAFEVTYVRLLFYSPRAESFAIYKRTNETGPWIPFQYYSSNCLKTYNVSDRSYSSQFDETQAMCTKEYSDISPLTGGNVVFTTLEGRPNVTHFETNERLQEFVTATDIRIVLDNMNTFGDEIFGDEQVLRSYYYAISDLSIGGICKCNGHANRCIIDPNTGSRRLVCQCQHNTDGPDCEKCLPFYNDQPWRRATTKNAYACQPCNCNGRSNKCFFDEALWRRTGHGGHCIECADNTSGPNCERCMENYYTDPDTNKCTACHCDPIGSVNLQCSNSNGQCSCKPGVEGRHCDRCAANYFDFGHSGCRPCGCSVIGSKNNTPSCDNKGRCECKKNVEGEKCDRCKPGFFDLQFDNDLGCVPCFCYGHSDICDSSPGFAIYPIESSFNRDSERWTAKDQYGNEVPVQYNIMAQSIVSPPSTRDNAIYFHAPYKFLEDKKYSYNRYLRFALKNTGAKGGLSTTIDDIVIEGNGNQISLSIFAQGNPLPSDQLQMYRYRLNEDIYYGWSPLLSARDFIALLSNITAIKIKGTYFDMASGLLDEVVLETAIASPGSNQATWVESCTCPEGHAGQHCESCAAGYKHDPPRGGRFARCVPCKCNNHGDYCDSESGRCSCKHNTGGDTCDRCAPGYYGNALQGTENDCSPCPCPNNGECTVLPDNTIACLNCPEGYGGGLCDKCVDGYMKKGLKCEKCDCNGNIDPNAVGNCNSITGQCLKCIYNTWGSNCEKCLPGHYGSALALPKGDCKACACSPFGTVPEESNFEYETARSMGYLKNYFSPSNFFTCDPVSGKCRCKPNVSGRKCDQCTDGYYDLESGEGCKACNCNDVGSENLLCDNYSGQCNCKPGVTGKHCDQCLPNHYGFGPDGCTKCDCDPIGSLESQCDMVTGQCKCRENVEGKQCERCQENKYNKEAGCIDCPPCYTLVQEAFASHREKLNGVKALLDEIEQNPLAVEDADFEKQLIQVTNEVQQLLDEAKRARIDDESLVTQLEEIKNRIRKIQDITRKVENQLNFINTQLNYGTKNITLAQEIANSAENDLNNAKNYLESDGRRALGKAKARAAKYGQQSERMSQIAREARLLADGHEKEAENIIDTFKEAQNVSETAYNLAKDAINTQKANKEALEKLKEKLREIKEQFQLTVKLSQDVHRDATKAEQDALALMADANNLIVPDLNSTQYKEDAVRVIAQAKQAREEADEILKKHEKLLNSTGDRLKNARLLFKDAQRQQQTLDDLFARADEAYNQTKEAVQTGDNILEDAKKTLKTLKEFDIHVKTSKDKAMSALDRIPQIEKDIDGIRDKSDEAVSQLNQALREASRAADTAKIAKDNAEYASKDSGKILEDVKRTKDKVDELDIQSTNLLKDVDRTSERMKNYETQAEEDKNLVDDALRNASQAKTSAVDAMTRMLNATSIVDKILKDLNSMEDMDEKNLSEQEQRLRDAERELKTADLDTRVFHLKKLNDDQKKWIHNYEDELAKLAADVANIAKIRQSLPDGCFRRYHLEP